MSFFYTFSIILYALIIKCAAIFKIKARKWVEGRKDLFINISNQIDKNNVHVWFHAASLGEFEQGRPVIEAFRKQYPLYKIILTFFSPSGFEIRKNYTGADYIYYLPVDTPKNAKKFLDIVNPSLVFFIKYEFWFNFIQQINKRNIPLFFLSVKFRPEQHFFQWYGSWFKTKLKNISWFFVQDESSKQLLEKINVQNVSVSGDTRFDRVLSISIHKNKFPLVERFVENSKVLIAGSTWPVDEEFLIKFINDKHQDIKIILAPHEIHPERISSFQSRIGVKSLKFSEISEQNISGAEVLIIDNIGMLLHLYQYAHIAYIGGGFGKSIHNILEAATFGDPVIFGPAFQKFQEAVDLISLGGAFSVNNYNEFSATILQLFTDSKKRDIASEICKKFVINNSGATSIIMKKISLEIADQLF